MGILTYLLINWLISKEICINYLDSMNKLKGKDDHKDIYLQFESTKIS